MPITSHTRKANTPKRKRMFQHVRESCEARGGSAGSCIAQASGVVKRDYNKKRRGGGTRRR